MEDSYGCVTHKLPECTKVLLDETRFGRHSSIPVAEEMRFLVSYGAQLEQAELMHFPITMCEVILGQCGNVRCSWGFARVPHAARILGAFTLLARALTVFSSSEVNWNSWIG